MSIHDLLNKPVEELLALSPAQLKSLLEPFIPAARKPLLPEEKIPKQGVQMKFAKELIEANREAIEALKRMKGMK